MMAWWHRLTPGQRRAAGHGARVTIAGCTGFYFCVYALQNTQMGLFAGFGAIATGALSEVSGSKHRRLVSYLTAFGIGVPLIIVGTLLAKSNIAATIGMLVVGLLIGLAATGGGRMLGLANGLQLLYILPSFPPYAPDALLSRLIGLLIGVTLLIICDIVVRPATPAPGYEQRIADTLGPVLAHLQNIRNVVAGRANAPTDGVADVANAALIGLRPELLPVSRRPVGPSPADHALRGAALSVRMMENRIIGLDRLLRQGDVMIPGSPAQALLEVIEQQATLCQAALSAADSATRGHSQPPPDPSPAAMRMGYDTFQNARAEALGTLVLTTLPTDLQLRFGSVTGELAEATEGLVLATRSVLGRPDTVVLDNDPLGKPFIPQQASSLRQWQRNLRVHLNPHSVILQNAVRLSIGLAVARFVAGTFDLAHGFWVLLATLTLMRTTISGTRTAIRPVMIGTLVGAVAAALLLTLCGGDPWVFLVILPIVMFTGFTAGGLGSPLWGQASFTLVVAALFTQVSPSDWKLAEARVIDVIAGAAIGIITGLLVWPRGGGGLMRSAMADYLSAAASLAENSVKRLVDRDLEIDAAQLHRVRSAQILADTTYAQFHAERPSDSPDVSDPGSAFTLARRLAMGALDLRVDRTRASDAVAEVEAAGHLLDLMAEPRVATCQQLALAVLNKDPTTVEHLDERHTEIVSWLKEFHGGRLPELALDVVDTRSWLVGVGHDAELLGVQVNATAANSAT